MLNVASSCAPGAEGEAHLRFFQSMDRVNRAIVGTNDLEQMMSDVLDAVLAIFDCDRAWLLHPCEPEAASWRVPMERTRPEYPGAFARNLEAPMNPDTASVFRAVRAASGPVRLGPGGEHEIVPEVAEEYQVRAMLAMALYPKGDSPYMFGIHQCSHERQWTSEDVRLLQEIGRRLSDGLTSLLAVRRLRDSEARYRAVVDNATDALFVMTERGVIEDVNRQACDSLGYSREELIGATPFLFNPELDPASFARRMNDIGEGHALRLDTRHRRKDGSTFPVEVRARRMLGEGRWWAVTLVRDMTERKRLEEHLQVAQKMEAVGQLAGGVAHDFNNLLTVIGGYSDVLLGSLAHTPRLREQVHMIREATQKAARLTSQLLAFSRKAIVEPRVLDLNEVIESTGKMLSRLIGEDVALAVQLRPGLSPVLIDRGQVEQVIMNLAVNARDAMPRGGRLIIETDEIDVRDGGDELRPGRYVRLRVADTGSGMTEEVRARIFEPFFTTKGVGRGTGLGLATVYGIVCQASGVISVETQVGAGTVFTILLPAVSAKVAPVSADPDKAPYGTETLLLVEDEDAVRRLAREVLRRAGYTVLEASRGAEALRIAEAHAGTIHLLLTDVVMPGLGGRDLADAVRARRPSIRVLYMSGFTDDAVVRHGVSSAADALLQKPFTPLALACKVRSVLDEAPAPAADADRPAPVYHPPAR